MTEPSDEHNAVSGRARDHSVELLSIVLLSVAGLAASWSSYQAARWGGVQSTQYSRASALRVESTRASVTADDLRAVDLAAFMSWVDAYASNDTLLQEFYEKRFRAEFKPAFEAWIASRPLVNRDAAPTPFQLDEYRLAKDEESAELLERAERVFKTGQEANQRSDSYVLTAVVLASVLFLSGIAQQFRILHVQLVLLGLASVLLAVGLFNIVMLPKLP